MAAGESSAAAAEYDDDDVASSSGSGGDGRRGAASGCSCLPLCFWKSRSRGTAAAPSERGRRRRRFRLMRLSWFSWPWLRKSRGGTSSKEEDAGGGKDKKKAGKRRRRRRRLLLLLLTASKQAKKALAPVSSAGSLLAKVSSFGGAKKQNQLSNPRRTIDDDDDDAAPATTCITEMAPGAIISSPRPAPGGAWRAPSSRARLHSLQPDRGGTDLWTAATTLGVIVFFGRVTAIIFLCSCLYGARQFVAERAGGGEARGRDIAIGDSSRRLGDQVAVELWTEEYKKKVVMDGLLDRAAGKRPSSRFCK